MFKDFRKRKDTLGANVVALKARETQPAAPTEIKPDVDTDLQARLELKSRLHEGLLDRLNLPMLDKVEKPELKRQIAGLVTKLLEDEGVPMRTEEFSILVDELIFEVMGLGPLEPLLADPTVNDILVNTHTSVYVERFEDH